MAQGNPSILLPVRQDSASSCPPGTPGAGVSSLQLVDRKGGNRAASQEVGMRGQCQLSMAAPLPGPVPLCSPALALTRGHGKSREQIGAGVAASLNVLDLRRGRGPKVCV